MKPRKFVTDTKSLCFLCLQKIVNEDDNFESSAKSLISLSRCFKVDFGKLLHNLKPARQVGGLEEETDLIVSLCKNCCIVSNTFDKLWHELELVRLKLNASVERIHQLMTSGEQLMDPDWLNIVREEIQQKYATHVKKSFPQVKLERILGPGVKTDAHHPKLAAVKCVPDALSVGKSNNIVNYPDSSILRSMLLPPNFPISCESSAANQHSAYDGDSVEIKTEVVEEVDLGETIIKVENTEESEMRGELHTDREDPLQEMNCEMDIDQTICIKAEPIESSQRRKLSQVNRFKKCVICSKLVPKSFLYSHIKVHSAISIPCPHCPHRYSSHHHLQQHMRLKHMEIKCQICNLLLKSKKTLQRHILNQHKGNAPYKCSECHKSFKEIRSKRHHLLQSHFMSLFKDCKTQDRFPKMSLTLVENGLRSMIADSVVTRCGTLFECTFCRKQYKNHKTGLLYHVVQEHRHILISKLVERPQIYPLGDFPCRQDKSSGTTASAVDNPYHCSYCPKKFRLNKLLKRHTIVHHRPNIFAEAINPTLATDPAFEGAVEQLFLNFVRFSGEKGGRACTYCSKVFINKNSKQNLERHLIQIHFDLLETQLRLSFQGDYPACDRKVRENGMKPCPFCPEVFQNKSELRCHKLRSHLKSIYEDCCDSAGEVTYQSVEAELKNCLQNNYNVNGIGQKELFKCSVCQTSFRQKRDVECHVMQTHLQIVRRQIIEKITGRIIPDPLANLEAPANTKSNQLEQNEIETVKNEVKEGTVILPAAQTPSGGFPAASKTSIPMKFLPGVNEQDNLVEDPLAIESNHKLYEDSGNPKVQMKVDRVSTGGNNFTTRTYAVSLLPRNHQWENQF